MLEIYLIFCSAFKNIALTWITNFNIHYVPAILFKKYILIKSSPDHPSILIIPQLINCKIFDSEKIEYED